MTFVQVVAPMLVDFETSPGAEERNRAGYAAMWQRVAHRLNDVPVVQAGGVVALCEHASGDPRGSRYSQIDRDDLDRTHSVVTMTIGPDVTSVPALPRCFTAVSGIRVRLHGHSVALVEASLEVSGDRRYSTGDGLDVVQREAVAYAEELGRALNREVVEPIVELVRRVDRPHDFVVARRDDDDDAAGHTTVGGVFWVSRALVVAPRQRKLLAHWTKDVVGGEHGALREALLAGGRNSLVRWLNYGFVDTENLGSAVFSSGEHADEYAGLVYAQVLYASLDHVDACLKQVLAESAASMSSWELGVLRSTLRSLSSRAELLFMERQSLQKYMTRRVRSHFEAILSAWDYEALIEQPVLFKVDLCQRRLGEAAERRQARSSLITDVILLIVAITSIAATALALTDFGRGAATDPLSTGVDMGGNAFTSWFASQPIDTVLAISFAASGILVVLYLYFRRRDQE
jgi:hypothetical protein